MAAAVLPIRPVEHLLNIHRNQGLHGQPDRSDFCDRSLTAVTRSPGHAAQQELGFKMSHVEAKSINIWLRYDQKQYITSCLHTYTQT